MNILRSFLPGTSIIPLNNLKCILNVEKAWLQAERAVFNVYCLKCHLCTDSQSQPVLMTGLREHLLKKRMFSFGHCPNYLSPPSPSFGQLVHLFRPSKINIYIVFFNSGKGLPPPHSGNARKKTFFLRKVFP